MKMGKRPFGVGLLVVGHDEAGTHVFETLPSGEYYEYNCHAIGAKSQSARTYFENHVAKFKHSTLEQLVLHGLKALKSGHQEENEYPFYQSE